MKRWLAAFAVAGLLATTSFAQEGVAQETQEGKQSPEGGGYGAGPDVHESEAHGIENWWDLDYKKKQLPPPFGFALINFAIFLAIMGKLAWKPLKQFVADRHDGIAKNLHEAAELRAAAEATLKQYQEKIRGIDREIETLLAQIRKEAETEKARIMAAAEADAKRLKLDAEKQIAAEIDRARRELRRGVIEAAVAAAEQSLQKHIAADDQRKMAEKYVADVEARAKAGRPS
jgi:F-type H+-transporting ATPase subunit b